GDRKRDAGQHEPADGPQDAALDQLAQARNEEAADGGDDVSGGTLAGHACYLAVMGERTRMGTAARAFKCAARERGALLGFAPCPVPLNRRRPPGRRRRPGARAWAFTGCWCAATGRWASCCCCGRPGGRCGWPPKVCRPG